MNRYNPAMNTDWDELFSIIEDALRINGNYLPSVSQIAESSLHDPFEVLISTVISLRTKDEVTISASRRLFQIARNPASIMLLAEELIAKAIFPAGYYKTRARSIKQITRLLVDCHGGQVPPDKEALLQLPGVGPKTANLTLNLGFGIEAICVDTHVHRISNRLGWVSTTTPLQTEKALEVIMPKKYWISLNELLVTFGQRICKPVSPWCSRCPLADQCPRHTVLRTR